MKLSTLKNWATIGAEKRGHRLGKWEDFKPAWGGDASNNHCTRCQRWVQVLTNPPPNGIDIGGTAVALNCEG